MEKQIPEKDEPLHDIFATQGILVVLICISVFTLHLCAPAFCRELLSEWYRIAAESTAVSTLACRISEWFVSICSG